MQSDTVSISNKIQGFAADNISYSKWQKMAIAACAGMADPAKEIERLKNCSDELDIILNIIPADAPCIHAETGETVADYILDLQKEVGRVHALYFNASQQLEAMRESLLEQAKINAELRAKLVGWHENETILAMREVIREAYAALDGCREDTRELSAERDWWKTEPRCGYSVRWADMQDRILKAAAVLAKLQPFTTP